MMTQEQNKSQSKVQRSDQDDRIKDLQTFANKVFSIA